MVNRRGAVRAATAVVVLVLAGACAGPGAPRPPAAPDGTPREVTMVVRDPCALLTEDEAEGLGLSTPDAADSGLSITCSWRLDEDSADVQLNASAHADQSVPFSHFPRLAAPGVPETTTVAGLPGVFTASSILPSNHCELGVRVGPTHTVELSLYDAARPQQTCDIVRRAAEVMVRALPARS